MASRYGVVFLVALVTLVAATDARKLLQTIGFSENDNAILLTFTITSTSTDASIIVVPPAGATSNTAPGTVVAFSYTGTSNTGGVALSEGVATAGRTVNGVTKYYSTFHWEFATGMIQLAGIQNTNADGTSSGVFSITGGSGEYTGAYGSDTYTETAAGATDVLRVFLPKSPSA